MAGDRGIVLNPKFLILAAALLGAGCMTNDNATDLIGTAAVPVPVTEIAGNHSIFVATTREASTDAKVFTNSRSPKLNFARVNVTVPKEHKTGQIERNKPGKPDDPVNFFTATEVVAYDAQPQFSSALSADIAARGGRAMVFIHGYNTSFDSAVYRATQIAHDSGYPGTPVLFSWASGGSTKDYVYDRESASVARDQLEVTLRLLAQSGARRIDIVAHSMGTWVTMETLRQLALSGDRDLGGKLGDVVLASPDIDVDVFKSQMRRYGKPNRPFFLMLSADDRALRLSSILAGNKRVGDYGDPAELAELGVVAVDISHEKGADRLNHTKFADNPALVKLLGQRLREDDGYASDREVTDRINMLGQGT
jgi:esterase/lipase superfamily enzyme